jgi:PAS domain S-box-containing protein
MVGGANKRLRLKLLPARPSNMRIGSNPANIHKPPQEARRDVHGAAPKPTESGGESKNSATQIPLPSRHPWYVRLFFVVLLVAVAALLRLWLDSEFGLTLHYLTYFPAVFLAALLFGTIEGLCAIATAVLVSTNPFAAGALSRLTVADKVSILILVLSGILLSIVAGTLRSRTERLRDALEEVQSSQQRVRDEERRLREATTRFDSVVASADEAITGIDTCGIVTDWNKGAETIFGYSAQEMIGEPFRKLLPPGQEEEADEIVGRLNRGESFAKSEAQRIAKDGQIVLVSIRVTPIRDAQGVIVGASGIARDIGETVKLQRQLQQSQKMEAVGQLAGGIAHDFNNLLAIIVGALELQLPTLAGNDEATRRWEVANRAAVRGAELTRRLLAFSSQEHFKIASTDLSHSIRNTMEMAQRLIGPEIRVNLNLEKAMSRILVDPSGLESAVLNLVINARDAMMPKGGSLTVSTRTADLEADLTATLTGAIQPGSYACVSVSDTGCGMSADVIDRACEPFFTTKERGRGTGLGLSMVYGFVKHSGGGIRIYSEVGYGTTITFYLPFVGAIRNAPLAARPRPEMKEEASRAGRILIVDDEADLLNISVSYLTARGYTVVSARDGKEALRLLSESGAVDVLITDIVMGGGMDGMELAQEIHRLSPRTAVIYSSGFPADALSGRNLPLADALVLQKPYRLSELGNSIDQAIGIRRMLSVGAARIPVGRADDVVNATASPSRVH